MNNANKTFTKLKPNGRRSESLLTLEKGILFILLRFLAAKS